MPASPSRPAFPQWRDVDGTPIPLWRRIEQIAVSQQHGAMPSRLHQHGQVIRQPHLVRVLDPAPGGD